MATKKMTKFRASNPSLRAPKAGHMRHIKPEYSIHEGVSEMSINARYAETYTWCHADIHGRFEWKPKTLKLHVLPFDNIEFEPLMLEWVTCGFVERYEVDGQKYGRFINWEKHQYVNPHETYELPAPPLQQSSTCVNVPARACSPYRERDSDMESESEKVIEIKPTNPPSNGRKVGRPMSNKTDSKSKPSGQEWRNDFQRLVQRIAADKSVVFTVPLPDHVFEFIETLAKDITMRNAQNAVENWLQDRSLFGLANPNAIWSMMSDEMVGIVAEARDDHASSLRRAARAGTVQPTAAQIAEEEQL